MFELVNKMRTRVITSKAFASEHILAAILFENTMERKWKGSTRRIIFWRKKGVVPIQEPEVDIHSPQKKRAEKILKRELLRHLDKVLADMRLMFKLILPTKNGYYTELLDDPKVGCKQTQDEFDAMLA